MLYRTDGDYYALKDPAHLEFGKSLIPLAVKVQVVDFEDRSF